MKCIVLGLDGASYYLIEDLLRKEQLPNLKKISENGVFSPLKSTILPNSFPAWPVICTGKNPGKFNVFDFLRENADHTFTNNYSTDIKSEFVWEILEENEIKCGVINVPGCSPFRSKIEFGEGDYRNKDWVNFSWKDTTVGIHSTSNGFEERIKELIKERFDQIDYVYDHKKWEFLIMNINAVDQIGHHRWNNKEFLTECFKLIDQRVGSLLERHPELNMIIISDHGMQKVEKSFWTNNWLEQEGYLYKKENPPETKSLLTEKRAEKIIGFSTQLLNTLHLRKALSGITRRVGNFIIKRGKPEEYMGFPDFFKIVDWDKTIAYSHGHQGKIYLNKKKTSISENYESIVNEIQQKLKNQIEGIEIWKNGDIYNGEYSENGEDLMFIIKDNKIYPQTAYRKDGKIMTDNNRDSYMVAHHHRTGILFATGPDIKAGKIENASVYDITPTVLSMFGFQNQADMDGQPLDILKTEKKKIHVQKKEEFLENIEF